MTEGCIANLSFSPFLSLALVGCMCGKPEVEEKRQGSCVDWLLISEIISMCFWFWCCVCCLVGVRLLDLGEYGQSLTFVRNLLGGVRA